MPLQCKSDENELVQSYGSISLLPIPAKCLQHLVHAAIYADISPYLTESRLGFVMVDHAKHSWLLHIISGSWH